MDYVEAEIKRENSANKFTLAFLIPKKLVNATLDKHIAELRFDPKKITPRQFDVLIELTARDLKVQPMQLKLRILNLGLFSEI